MYEPTYYNFFEVVGRELEKWKDFYPDSQEMMPRHMPEALDKYIVIKYYMDSDQSVNIVNRRYNYGIIIYVNNTPVIWYNKRQKKIEASTFGFEFFY